ncbi:hypothetical protein DIPPA_35196 [Diplonema papillatum]|nr:hypothetical protein DIPPA_35196 [Diplonema papillatum]
MHYPFPRNGVLRCFLRSLKYSVCNSQTNVGDMRRVLLERETVPPVVVCISDNASDYSPAVLSTDVSLWRLFRDFQHDAVVCVTYAAGHSAFNPVERAMSWMSKAMSGCKFGTAEKRNPEEDRKMHVDAMQAMAEKLTFNTASGALRFHSVPVDLASARMLSAILPKRPKKRKPVNPATLDALVSAVLVIAWTAAVHTPLLPYTTACISAALTVCVWSLQTWQRKGIVYNDYDDIRLLLSSSKKRIRGDPKLRELHTELLEMSRHMDRRKNMVVFRRCSKPSSCGHCKNLPALRARHFLDREMQEATSGLFYTPIPHGTPDEPFQQQVPASQASAVEESRESPEVASDSEHGSVLSQDSQEDLSADDDPQPFQQERPEETGHFLCLEELLSRKHIEVPTDFYRPSLRAAGRDMRCPTCKVLCLNPSDRDRHFRLHHETLSTHEASEEKKRVTWKDLVKVAKKDPDSQAGRSARVQLLTVTQLRTLASKAVPPVPLPSATSAAKGLLVSSVLAAWDRVHGLLEEVETGKSHRYHVPTSSQQVDEESE